MMFNTQSPVEPDDRSVGAIDRTSADARPAAEARKAALTLAEAVDAGHVVITDTVGNGRADVISFRIRRLIDRGVDPRTIAVLAANRHPLDLLPDLPHGVADRLTVGSVFWFLLRTLRTVHFEAGLPKNFLWRFSDEATLEIGHIAERLELVSRKRGHAVAQDLKAMFDVLTLRPELTVERIVRDQHPRFRNHEAGVHAVYGEYGRWKADQGCVTTTDVLAKLSSALRTSCAAQAKVTGVLKHIFIDCGEALGISVLDCLSKIAVSGAKMFVVANEAFRFDDLLLKRRDTMSEVSERFEAVTHCTARPSGRRRPSLQCLLNALQVRAPGVSATQSDAQPAPAAQPLLAVLHVSPDEGSRDGRIIDQVLRLVAEGSPLSEQAILCFDAAHSLGLQQSLIRANVPFRVIGAQGVDRIAHVTDVLSVLRIIVNHRDVRSWQQAMRRTTKLGESAMNRLIAKARTSQTLESALARVADLSATEFPRHHKGVAALVAALHRASRLPPPGHQFDAALSFLEPALERQYRDRTYDRLRELDEMRQTAGSFDTLQGFLDAYDANPSELRSGTPGPRGVAEAKSMLTISASAVSRGQEWAAVHVLLLNEAYLAIPPHDTAAVDDAVGVRAMLYSVVARATRQLTFHICHPRDRKLEIPKNTFTELLKVRDHGRS